MPGFSCFLLKYAGRMRDEAYLDLIGCCGRARTVTNAAVSMHAALCNSLALINAWD